MAYILLGIGIFLVGLSVVHWFVRSDPAALRSTFGKGSIVFLLLLAAAMMVTGRIGGAFLMLVIGAVLGAGSLRKRASHTDRTRNPVRPVSGQMSVGEALDVLGLQSNAGKEEVRAAHRRLIRKLHPDHGGTADLAARVNEAKEILLRRID